VSAAWWVVSALIAPAPVVSVLIVPVEAAPEVAVVSVVTAVESVVEVEFPPPQAAKAPNTKTNNNFFIFFFFDKLF
jgi:hypothetical protein